MPRSQHPILGGAAFSIGHSDHRDGDVAEQQHRDRGSDGVVVIRGVYIPVTTQAAAR